MCVCVCTPLHSRPESLLPVQHLQDEFAPILLEVVRMEALRELDATKLYPHLDGHTHTHSNYILTSHHASVLVHTMDCI